MPLSRNNLTASSRVMLIAYPTFSGLVGLSYTLGDPQRTSSPAFDVVRTMMPMTFWGLVFMALTAGEVVALAIRKRQVMVLMLCAALGFYASWTAGFVLSLFTFSTWLPGIRDDVPLTSIWLWSFVCVAHVASLRSLTRDVVVTA